MEFSEGTNILLKISMIFILKNLFSASQRMVWKMKNKQGDKNRVDSEL